MEPTSRHSRCTGPLGYSVASLDQPRVRMRLAVETHVAHFARAGLRFVQPFLDSE